MAELDKYTLYLLANGQNTMVDKVDSLISQIDTLKDFDSICKFVSKNFGEFDGLKTFEYPKTNKRIWIRRLDNAVECWGEVNDSFYYRKGWRNVKK